MTSDGMPYWGGAGCAGATTWSAQGRGMTPPVAPGTAATGPPCSCRVCEPAPPATPASPADPRASAPSPACTTRRDPAPEQPVTPPGLLLCQGGAATPRLCAGPPENITSGATACRKRLAVRGLPARSITHHTLEKSMQQSHRQAHFSFHRDIAALVGRSLLESITVLPSTRRLRIGGFNLPAFMLCTVNNGGTVLPPEQLQAAGVAGEKGGRRAARGTGCCLAAAGGFLLLVALAFLARQWQQLPYPAAGARLAPWAFQASPCRGAS